MPHTTFNGPTVPKSVIDDGDIRVIFKIYFMVIILVIAFLGSHCLKFYIQRQLLKGKSVELATTTGWINGPALAKTAFELRRIPGGWLGFIMLLTTALEIISDFGVAKTITLVRQESRTTAPAGMIIDNTTSRSEYPNPDFTPFNLATSAQIYSANNQNLTGMTSNSPYGIYRFINGYDFDFLAMPEDIIGYWSCVHNPQTPITYDQTFLKNATQIWDFDVGIDLIKRGLIYGGNYAQVNNVSIFNSTYQGPSLQLVIWTASNYTRGSTPSFTFAVETLALDDVGSKEMDVFNCSLHSTGVQEIVFDVLQHIDVIQTMTRLSTPITGALYPGWWAYQSYDLATVASTIEYYLNAIIMVAGSGQQTATPNTQGYTYGVLEYATVIPYWIIVVAVLAFVLALLMLFLLIHSWLSNKKLIHAGDRQDSNRVSIKHIAENTPVGLLGWMSHAAAVNRNADSPKEKDLKDFILSTTWHGDMRLGVFKAENHGLLNGEMKRERVHVNEKT